jgi:hypothetical protein
MSSSWSIQAPILVGFNYDFWSEKVKAIFQGQGCWDCVEAGFKNLQKFCCNYDSFPKKNIRRT